MAGRQCYHCKQWIEDGAAHDCWTTTEAALTRELPEDLQGAWERLREAAVEFGEQRIYASHNSIMFSRKACYFFVRPRPKALEICFFLRRTLRTPLVRRTMPASRTKVAHMVHVRHRDEVEAPLTDWLREAYEVSETVIGSPEQSVAVRTSKAKSVSRTKPAATKKAKRASPAAAGRRARPTRKK